MRHIADVAQELDFVRKAREAWERREAEKAAKDLEERERMAKLDAE